MALVGGLAPTDPEEAAIAKRLTLQMADDLLPWLGLGTEDQDVRSAALRLFVALARKHPSIITSRTLSAEVRDKFKATLEETCETLKYI